MSRKGAFAVGRMEKMTPLLRIMQKTGREPVECKCQLCKRQCQSPCLGTPQDILKLMDAGYTSRLKETEWVAGVLMGVIKKPLIMVQAEIVDDGEPTRCTFFTADGLCELHDKGLKPTEGRLSHHSMRIDNWKPSRSITWAVAQEWLMPENADAVKEVFKRFRDHGRTGQSER